MTALNIEEGVARGTYRVRGDEWFLQGHFPNNPVVPGVILCEIMAQTCGVLIGDKLKGNTPYYTGLKQVKFKAQVHPGDLVEVVARLERTIGVFYFSVCQAYVGGNLCCEGHLSFALAKGR